MVSSLTLRACRAAPVALAAALALAGAAASAAPAAKSPTATVRVLAFNDFHGALESPGTYRANASAAAVPAGGADVLAGYVAAARAAHPRTVVVSAGDLVGASPMLSALYHDEPTIEAMNLLGLDFNVLGNHEFDDGRRELMRLQRGGCHPNDTVTSCARTGAGGERLVFEGSRARFLSANVVREAGGAPLVHPYGIRSFEVDGRRLKVAFVGATLRETPTIVSPSGVRGLRFTDEAAALNALVPALRAKGVEAIVAVIHQGGTQAVSGTADINACAGDLAGSAIQSIVSQLDDAFDAVMTGHTHVPYVCQVANAAGRAIPVTQTAANGRVLTQLDLTLDRGGHVVATQARNVVVDRTDPSITPHAGIAALVADYKARVAPIANRVLGAVAADVPNSRDAACAMPAGHLVADAMLAATAAPAQGGAQLALMNPGGVRSPGFLYAGSAAGEGDGQVTYGEAFTVQPFGNSLVTMTLTSAQLRTVLEQQFPGCLGQTSFSRVMLPSTGVRYEWDHTQACGAKVRNFTLTTGGVTHTLVDAAGQVGEPDRTWRVTVNSFMADGGDAFSTFLQGQDRLGGAQDIDALEAYLAGFKAPKAPYNPASVSPRIVRVDTSTATCP
ncbi:bifunctional metallophosphatase/5'-nucleotidase [Ideonella livida]|uniref:Bifunctional metallophosphatase/5'-nucleotidase n=1 Tax=Ideonella livida TaxID=2707176 RepID=A0A7C9TNW1_9BURK|nr:bifunctional metallophosphatase/5'-nucleotidase [Ideonella livida]NDY94025.1 bifunctional metallophosphatase/5'-nucleotidase [Ideonella livida]